MRKFVWALAVTALLASAQEQPKYVDVTTVKVRPDRYGAFQGLARQIADANRKHKGDLFVGAEVVYGDGFMYRFFSIRNDFASIQTGMDKFRGALVEEMGLEGMMKFWDQMGATVQEVSGEIWVRRPDLSVNAPSDDAAYAKMWASARWMRQIRTRVKPGRAADWEKHLKFLGAAISKSPAKIPYLVASAGPGLKPGFYSATSIVSSLADLDKMPPVRELMGEDEYERYSAALRDLVMDSEVVTLSRIVPEMSVMPEAVTSLAPEFWNPKPHRAAAAKKKK
jgi:hypothetical protein